MANNVIKRTWNQNKMVCIEDLSGMAFQSESGGHTFEISGTNDSGTAVSLSGTVEARFLRADNVKVTIAGTISSGKASVTLTSNCYTVAGRFSLTIFVTSNSQKVAVYSAVGNVVVTDGVSSGTVPPLVTDSIQTGSMTASGNATINGVLDVTQRRCYATLTGANTWYRVLTFNADSANQAAGYAGCVIDLNIGRKGADNETHSIRLEIASNNIAFSGEKSVSVNKYIDKIRYWRNDNIGYIDIHTLSSDLIVWVDFNVHDAYSSQQNYSANSLEAVSAAPAGSLVAEYTFSEKAYQKPVAAEGISNGWSYVLYTDNTIDAIRTITNTQTYYSTANGFYGYYIADINLPFTMADTNYYIGTAWSIGSGYSVSAGLLSVTTTKFNAYGLGTYGASNASVKLTMHLKGTIA